MKYLPILILLGILWLLDCKQTGENGPAGEPCTPLTYMAIGTSTLTLQHDSVYDHGVPFSGFLYQLQPNGTDTVVLASYLHGVQHGSSRKWYDNGQLMEDRQFLNGAKHGLQVAYWNNGKIKFEFTAYHDAYEGTLKEWNVNGTLFHEANFVQGQEEGLQRMWYDNGKLRGNYVVRNGKRYGLLGTKNCRNVSDSIFIVQ